MKTQFVKVANVRRFLAGIDTMERRGAPEASFVLVEGEAGFGKSETGKWWSVQENAVRVRAKAAATYHWVLKDILAGLDASISPSRQCERLYDQVFSVLSREQRPVVIDEVENTLNDIKSLQAVRDLTDFLEIPVVLIAREYVAPKLRKHPELWSRISDIVRFEACEIEDVALCCAELAECHIDDAVVARIHAESDGRIREVINAIAQVERIGKRHGGKATHQNTAGAAITKDFQRKKVKLQVVK